MLNLSDGGYHATTRGRGSICNCPDAAMRNRTFCGTITAPGIGYCGAVAMLLPCRPVLAQKPHHLPYPDAFQGHPYHVRPFDRTCSRRLATPRRFPEEAGAGTAELRHVPLSSSHPYGDGVARRRVVPAAAASLKAEDDPRPAVQDAQKKR